MGKSKIITTSEILMRQSLIEAGAHKETVVGMSNAQKTIEERDTEIEELRAKLAKAEKSTSPAKMRGIIDELCNKYGVEPAEELIKLATERDAMGQFVLPNGERIKIWSELIQYRMPKMKSLEVQGQVDHNITIKVVSFRDNKTIEQVKVSEPIIEAEVTS
jgi:hypothetical protein